MRLLPIVLKKKEKRFLVLIHSLKESKNVEEQLVLISLIENITKKKPTELDFRVALHAELFRLGLQELIDEIKKTPAYDTDLGDVIDNFEEDVKGDREDLEKKFQGLEIDFTSVEKIAAALQERISPTPAFHSLLSILRDLVLLPGDTEAGLKAWILIERLVMQVSIQKQALVLDEQSVKLEDLFAAVGHEVEAIISQQQLTELQSTNQKLERTVQQKDIEIREITTTIADLKQKSQEKQKAIDTLAKEKENLLEDVKKSKSKDSKESTDLDQKLKDTKAKLKKNKRIQEEDKKNF